MYILSAPKTSLKPSELESLPLRRDCCGIGIPRGECNLAAAAAAACAAVDEVAPADVEWPREVPGAEDGVDTEYDVAAAVAAPADEDVVGWDLLADEGSEGGAGCCRKAAKKPERKKGRWGAIAGLVFGCGIWRVGSLEVACPGGGGGRGHARECALMDGGVLLCCWVGGVILEGLESSMAASSDLQVGGTAWLPPLVVVLWVRCGTPFWLVTAVWCSQEKCSRFGCPVRFCLGPVSGDRPGLVVDDE